MRCSPRTARCLLSWFSLVALLSGCQSPPAAPVAIAPTSSLLAVDVRYPSPLGRDHSLVQVFFAKGPIDAEMAVLPELIPATFVKRSRAYLLDPEPGTYSLVAVTSQVAPDWNRHLVAGGVARTVSNEEIGHVAVFPAELVHRTQAAIGPGEMVFMGALRVRRSDRINANAVLQDGLQQRIAERIRPGATAKDGPGGWLSMTWMVDLEETSLRNDAADRALFFDEALTDLGASPWAQVIARAAPRKAPAEAARASMPPSRETTTAGARTPEPREATAAGARTPEPREFTAASARTPEPDANGTAPSQVTAASPPQVAVPDPSPATSEPNEPPLDPQLAMSQPNEPPPDPQLAMSQPSESPPAPEPALAEPSEASPAPERRLVPGIPPDSPLAKIELGMHHAEVRKILGDPDERIDRQTAKAWIPFYEGPGARLIDWIYAGIGRVVFSQHTGLLEVFDVVHDPATRASRNGAARNGAAGNGTVLKK